jgi:hypothetical protein
MHETMSLLCQILNAGQAQLTAVVMEHQQLLGVRLAIALLFTYFISKFRIGRMLNIIAATLFYSLIAIGILTYIANSDVICECFPYVGQVSDRMGRASEQLSNLPRVIQDVTLPPLLRLFERTQVRQVTSLPTTPSYSQEHEHNSSNVSQTEG